MLNQQNIEKTLKPVIQGLQRLNKSNEDLVNRIGNLETRVGALEARAAQEQPLQVHTL